MRADFVSEESEALKIIEEEQEMIKRLEQDKIEMAVSRKAKIGKIATKNLKK
jgi:hypothetical protein